MKESKNSKRKQKILPKYLTKQKIELILDRARPNKRDYVLLLTLWRTGLRVSELTNLKKRDIDYEEHRIIVHQGKGNRDRWVPLAGYLGDLLSFHMSNMNLDDIIFPISSTQVRNITHKYQGEENLHPHTFRHSYAVHCLKNGVNIRVLQKLLGHEDLSTTAVYLDLVGVDIMKEFSKMEW